MQKFVIITDSCSDLNEELRQQYDIHYVPMHFHCQGKQYDADLDWKEISAKDFYDLMRDGNRIMTAQVTAPQYTAKFEEFLKEGFDVLSISCSSALSGSVNASYVARDELAAKYPERKIICIDSLISCFGLGMLCMRASELRAEGKTIEETAAWIEENKLNVHQEATVERLAYLKQAGRVTAASAFFGTLLSIKPIIISDEAGQNAAVEKVKGRKTSLERIVERTAEAYQTVPYQKIYIGHADAPADAQILKEKLQEKLQEKCVEIGIGYIGPIVGASVGPGTVGIYFYGDKVQTK